MTRLIRNSIVIDRSLEEVFAFVTDPLTTSQWQSNLVRSEILTPGPMGVGTQVLEVRRLGKAESQAVWEVTEYTPPTRRDYVYPKGFGPVRQRGSTTFEAIEGATWLSFTAQLEAGFPFKLFLPILARLMRRQNDRNFTALKRLLESGVQAAINHAS